MKIRLLVAIISVTSLVGCEGCKNDPKPKTELEKLPVATQTGKNTFGCLVDGKAWVIKTSIDAQSFYQEGLLSIGAFIDNKNVSQGIGFNLVVNNLSETNYILDGSTDHFAQFGDNNIKCLFLTSAAYVGSLFVTNYDNQKFIISGTFEFDAYSDDCEKMVKITNGRFDLNYAP